MVGWEPSVWPAAVYHFSEDAAIERFVPHVPPTNPNVGAHVWAIDADHAPLYWFPRQCPRVTVWARDAVEQARLTSLFGAGGRRLHWAEQVWLPRIRAVELFAYEFDATPFVPWPTAEGQWVTDSEVAARSVGPVGDCVARHRDAGIELRLVDDLWPHVDAVVASGLPFSIVRIRNAASRTPTDVMDRGDA
jgi:hypothetical protein